MKEAAMSFFGGKTATRTTNIGTDIGDEPTNDEDMESFGHQVTVGSSMAFLRTGGRRREETANKPIDVTELLSSDISSLLSVFHNEAMTSKLQTSSSTTKLLEMGGRGGASRGASPAVRVSQTGYASRVRTASMQARSALNAASAANDIVTGINITPI